MKITDLWRYPVKSMGGQRLTSTDVGDLGIAFDRAWGVHSPATQTVLTGRREPKLLLARAEVDNNQLMITLDDGTELAGDGPAASSALSDWLGYEVALCRAGERGGTYENPLDVDAETDWMSWTGPPGAWHDSGRARLSILSTASARHLDPRRFRVNIWTDGPADKEDDLVGQQVTVGTAKLAVTQPIERCIMVTRPQEGLASDRDVLRWVIKHRDNSMGIGATVTEAGRIAVGDELLAN